MVLGAQDTNSINSLAGEPPLGVNYSPCMSKAQTFSLSTSFCENIAPRLTNLNTGYQSSPTAGDAACSKNGIVYGQNGTFPVPGAVSSSSAVTASATPSTPANATTGPYATGTTGPGSTLTPSPLTYTGAASPVLVHGDISSGFGSAVALFGLLAGMGWFL